MGGRMGGVGAGHLHRRDGARSALRPNPKRADFHRRRTSVGADCRDRVLRDRPTYRLGDGVLRVAEIRPAPPPATDRQEGRRAAGWRGRNDGRHRHLLVTHAPGGELRLDQLCGGDDLDPFHAVLCLQRPGNAPSDVCGCGSRRRIRAGHPDHPRLRGFVGRGDRGQRGLLLVPPETDATGEF